MRRVAKNARPTFVWAVSIISFLALVAAPTYGSNIKLSADAQKTLDLIYSGDPDAAVAAARAIERDKADEPLGFLLEGEALWWKRYCDACEVKYGMVEAWAHSKRPEDESYLALTDRAVELAKQQLAKGETAELHFFVGMAYALKVRVYGLRNENRNAARAGVNARGEMMRALELDPQLADATGALGLYNYYVDTLSPVVKLLRFFMGIPGGNKELGVKQMETGMNQGTMLAVDLRFILARALRQYDQKYEEALGIAEPLTTRYPQNAFFLLLAGNLNAELGRNAKASEYFRQAREVSAGSLCVDRSHGLATTFLRSQR